MTVAALLKPDRTYDYVPIEPASPVIPRYRLAGEKRVEGRPSIFGDKVWDLDHGIAAPNVGSSSRFMNYDDYPEHLRDLIWSFCWCAMNIDHHSLPVHMEAAAPSRIKKEARSLLRYCKFMEARGVALRDVTDEDNDAWMALFRDRHYSGRVRAAAVPKRLYWYRHHLPIEIFNQQPWKDRGANDVLGKAPDDDENTTERIPQSVLEPMFRWASFYIDAAYADAFNLATGKIGRGTDIWATFAKIPGTNVEWRGPLGFREKSFQEAHFLVTAAYIITAYLSGMRDGEVQSIKKGARTVKRDEDGVPYRHLVKSTAFKKSGQSTGKSRTWIVLPEVHLALERLEELAEVMRSVEPDPDGLRYADHLFRRFGLVKSRVATLQERITYWLNEFQEHVNELADKAAAAAKTQAERDTINNLYRIPPIADGTPWRWQSKQFRRTVAWYIANEPFGTVAGMRQYGHVREVTFQGYAGTVEAGFRDDVDYARAVGKMRDILEMYEDVLEGASLGGPKGARLEDEFRTIAERLGDLPGKIVDETRLLAMLKNVAKEIYLGLVNDCFFDAATALCLRRPEVNDRSKPHFAQCAWEKCPNSCFWRKHRPALQSSLDEAKEHRRRPGLSKNQRAALDVVISKYTGALDKVDHAG